METPTTRTFSFSDFTVDVSGRRVTRHGKTLRLKAKTFDLLAYLVKNGGRVVSKDEILRSVWEDQFVEEANLAVQISALRKALGDKADDPRFIVTIPGRGYEFIAQTSAANEFVISDREFSRISVEETITEQTLAGSVLRWFTVPKAGVALALIAALVAAVYFFGANRSARTIAADPVDRQIQKRVFPASGGTPLYAAISPDGKTVAYVAHLKGQTSIWLGDIDSGNSIQVAPVSDRLYGFIKFGPDGKNLYFTVRDPRGSTTLLRMPVVGGAPVELTQAVDGPVTFSPDGLRFAFLRRDAENDGSRIIVADTQTGKGERVLVERGVDQNIISYGIAWSPDGNLIAFSGPEAGRPGSAVYGVNVDAGTIETLVATVPNRIVNLAWTADQKAIILNRNTSNGASDGQLWIAHPGIGPMNALSNDTLNYSIPSLSVSTDGKVVAVSSHTDPEIWVAPNADLSQAHRLLAGSWPRREGMAGLSAAPDGKIVFTANAGAHTIIWEMDSNGDGQRQLAAGENNTHDEQVAVTADDRFLIFQSDRSGTSQIWRASRDGSGPTQLTTDGENIEPTLGPRGDSIVYAHKSVGITTLWQISVEGGQPVQLTHDETAWPSVSPDGRFIACTYGRPVNSLYPNVAVIDAENATLVKLYPVPPRAALYNRLRWAPDGKALLYKDETQGLWKQDLDGRPAQQLVGADDLRINQMTLSGADLLYSAGVIKRDIVIFDRISETPK